ncbi:hypothetical protein NDU88_007560 [Pleurodeles waltl]|uniref:Uncharacterized protein n=1 Tax=Pleurodeles waltl TaxID=8319 RepID=A0AAV7N2E8_PLEWA|nr:hypothetical protein NDU88_007560 [Pleurodeles waltl]
MLRPIHPVCWQLRPLTAAVRQSVRLDLSFSNRSCQACVVLSSAVLRGEMAANIASGNAAALYIALLLATYNTYLLPEENIYEMGPDGVLLKQDV